MSSTFKTGVLLVNLGTPDSPQTKDVRKYLRQFLMDGRVIDIPSLSRLLLVNLIIAPFRAPKSSKVYKKLWTERGSPLLFYGEDLKKLLQEVLGSKYRVELAMRYQNPSISSVLENMLSEPLHKLIVVPLFPQYASASTGSVAEEVMRVLHKKQVIPSCTFIQKFPDHPLFITAFAERGLAYMREDRYDHFIFTYHGLPERQILKASCGSYCKLNDQCCSVYHQKNAYCYRAQCFQTSRLLAAVLGLSEDQYTTCFQSRLGKTPWIKPYTDDVIRELPGRGIKKVLAFSPSFVADCLETTIEIGEEYKELFEECGGEKWQLVESLNTHPLWVQCLKQMIAAVEGQE